VEKQIEDLVSDREKFNKFVYTSVNDAVNELEKRRSENLQSRVTKFLSVGVPEALNNQKRAVVFRQLVTPNYELRRFISLVDAIDRFSPLFFEYANDKYTDNNEWKYHLGKMLFYAGTGKKGGEKITRLNIIDFNTSRGKKISEVRTIWGQSLIDFHHELFDEVYKEKNKEIAFFDASQWFSKSGGNAKEYYKNFLALFVSHGLLFENFMLDVKELTFTKDIFLPAFIQVLNETGKKPLIVALEPTEVESNLFWMCHPYNTKEFVDSKLNSV